MIRKIKHLQIFYAVSLLLSCVFMILSFLDIIPSDYIGNEPRVLYWLNLYSIVSGLGGMYVCLRWFNFRCISTKVKEGDENVGFHSFLYWSTIRLSILALVLLSNMVLYQASSYTETPKYCMLIAYVAFVFCWPSKSAFEHVRGEQQPKSQEDR